MPSWLAGHSLGEYSALVAAEAMRFEDALPLVRFRAQAMQEAVPEGTGGIAAILGLDDAALAGGAAREAAQGEVLEPANLNSPGQVVIAGHRAAVERGMALAKAEGREARGDAADERAVALQPDEAGGRAPARAPRRDRGAQAPRFP